MFGRKAPCHLLDLDPGMQAPESLKSAGSALAESMAKRVREANQAWKNWTARLRRRTEKRLDALRGEGPGTPRAPAGHEHGLQHAGLRYISADQPPTNLTK